MEQQTMSAELAKALADFQANVPDINLDGEVKFKGVGFKYATLANILKTIRPALKEAGLTFTQILDDATVHTRIICVATGDFISSKLEIKTNDDPKQKGAAITYARRYALVTALGIIADEDSDAPEAQVSKPTMNGKQLQGVIEKVMSGEEGILQKVLQAFIVTPEQVRAIVEAEQAVAEPKAQQNGQLEMQA
jgi:hypothetical protein